MNYSKVDVWIGLFVVLGAAALVFLSLRVGNLVSSGSGSNYPVSALFMDVGGLKPSAAVKSAGVVIGRVDSISFDNETFQALVSINFDDRFTLPTDSMAKILTSGLLGEQYIGIEPGYEETNLRAGDRIDNTQSAVVLENVLGQMFNSKVANGN